MQKLIWKWFPPYEVKLTKIEINTFLKSHGSLCVDLVLQEAMALANDAEKTVYSIRIDHMKPDHLALLIITNVAGRQLSGGWHHTYRGVLSMVGKDLLAVWTAAVMELKKRGYYSEAEVDEDMKWIHNQISQVG